MTTIGPTALEQLGLLTAGYALPQRPVPTRLMRAVARELEAAWDTLLGQWPAIIHEEETQINLAMESTLRRRIRGVRLRDIVQRVTRGSECVAFDGRPEKRPDLQLHLTQRPFPLLVECKILRRPRPTIEQYANHGVMRFVDGRYAWQSREGFMAAYVVDGSTTQTTLRRHLHEHQTKYAVDANVVGISGVARDVATTVHRRVFAYPTRPGMRPDTITLWHLWLTPLGPADMV